VSVASSRAEDARFSVYTEVFDGPLDLLLHLVRRDGVDLRQVSISRIADAYLAWLARVREVHLGIASEYLVMAATLCHLKSLELLPRPPTPVDDTLVDLDPREALVRQLLDHQRFREAADALDDRALVDRDVFVRGPEPAPEGPRPVTAGLNAFELLDLFHDLLRRKSAAEAVHTVGQSGPDLSTCCRYVLDRFGGHGGRADLAAVFDGLRTRVERLLTFLAVLEMVRLRWLTIDQAIHLGPVILESRVAADADLGPVLGAIGVT
jgi:segregation and condensation protein A